MSPLGLFVLHGSMVAVVQATLLIVMFRGRPIGCSIHAAAAASTSMLLGCYSKQFLSVMLTFLSLFFLDLDPHAVATLAGALMGCVAGWIISVVWIQFKNWRDAAANGTPSGNG